MSEYNLGTARGRIELDNRMGDDVRDAQRQFGNLKSDLSSSSGVFANLGNDLDRIGERITGTFVTAAKVVGAAVAAVTGYTLWGGLQRVLDTEDARKLFGQMGSSASEVDDILEGLNKTFEKSSFSYPDVYNVGAQLTASGTALEDLNDQTRNVGDLAAFSGTEFGRVGEIITKIGAQGKVSGQELMSLANMGIPIRQVLADGLEISVEELNDMVSAGELTSDMFHDIIGDTEMISGSMETMADTTRGAWDTMKAGIKGAGEALLAPWFGENGTMVQFLKGVNEQIFSNVIPAFAAFGEWLSTVGMDYIQNTLIPALQNLVSIFRDRIVPTLQAAVEWVTRNEESIRKILAAIGPAAVALGALATSVHLVRKAWILLQAATPVGLLLLLISALIYAWQNSETFREVVTKAFNMVKDVIETVVDFVTNAIERVVGWFQSAGEESSETASWINEVWAQVVEIFATVGEILTELWTEFQEAFTQIRELLSAFIEWAEPVWSALWEGIQNTVQIVWELIKSIITAALDFIQGILDVVMGVITGDWDRIWNGIKKIFGAVWDAIFAIGKAVLKNLWNQIRTVINAVAGFWGKSWSDIRNFFTNLWNNLISWFSAIPGRVMGAIRDLISRARAWASDTMTNIRTTFTDRWNSLLSWFGQIPTRVINAVRGLLTRGRQWAREVVQGMRTAFIDRVNALLDWFRNIPQRIIGAIRNPGTMLRSVGRKIIQGLIDGIKNMAGNVKDAISGVLSKARNLLPFSPAKEGPFSGRGWTLYSGRSIIDALAEGIEDQERTLVKAASSVIDSAADIMSPNMMASLSATAVPTVASSGGRGDQFAFAFDFSGANLGSGAAQEIRDAVTSREVLDSLVEAARAGRRR